MQEDNEKEPRKESAYDRGVSLERLGRYQEAMEVYRNAWEESEDLLLIPRLFYLSYLLGLDEEARTWLRYKDAFEELPREFAIAQAAFHLAVGEKNEAEKVIRSLDTFDEEALDI